MKAEELIRIKTEAIRLHSLLKEKRKLKSILETKKGTYEELAKIKARLDNIEELLFGIDSEEDIAKAIANMYQFDNITSDTKKNIYYFEGYATKDPEEQDENYDFIFDDYLIYIPRDAKRDYNKLYYGVYRNIVDARDIVLILLQDVSIFEIENYIVDDGIDIPYQDEADYNRLRHSYINSISRDDPLETQYEQYRVELFRHLIEDYSEAEAISKLALELQRKNKK